MEDIEALADASFALFRALPKLVSTIPDRMPMMAMTTRSSINVKPFLFIILFFVNLSRCKIGIPTQRRGFYNNIDFFIIT